MKFFVEALLFFVIILNSRPDYMLVSLQLCQTLAYLRLQVLRHRASDASDSVVGLWKCKKALNIHDKSGLFSPESSSDFRMQKPFWLTAACASRKS